MLLCEVKVGIRDLRREDEAVMLHAARVPQLPEPLRSEHLAEGIRRVDGTVDEDVCHVYAFWRKLGIEGLTQHAPPAHGRRVRVLAGIAAHGSSGGCHENGAFTAFHHQRAHGAGEAEQTERG